MQHDIRVLVVVYYCSDKKRKKMSESFSDSLLIQCFNGDKCIQVQIIILTNSNSIIVSKPSFTRILMIMVCR